VLVCSDRALGAEVEYVPHTIAPRVCGRLLMLLQERSDQFEGGRKLTADGWSETPRLVLAFGDDASSFVDMGPSLPWFAELDELRCRLASEAGHPFNYALVNWYRDGDDHAGWHADKMQFHEPGTSIAIVSLGNTRRFAVRDNERSAILGEVDLEEGSVLWMRGSVQEHYEHAILRADGLAGARLSITFRCLIGGLHDDRPARDPAP
jgi:alkylated DNA repair dioxygenase AlkB